MKWIQDNGYRTFAMICPSLPQEDYAAFSVQVCEAINIDRCAHVWAEVINLRGASFERTKGALENAGLSEVAERLSSVSGVGKGKPWEDYARQTFLAHTKNIPPAQLRFLQYVNRDSASWWFQQRVKGAIPLGAAAVETQS